MKPIVQLFECALVIFLCGCQSWCGRYEAQHELRSPKVFPFRFQIKKLTLETEHYASAETCAAKSQKLKQYLPRHVGPLSAGEDPRALFIKKNRKG